MSRRSNFTLWQHKRKERRLKFIDEILQDLESKKIEFRYVSHLSEYVAAEIAKREREILQDRMICHNISLALSNVRECGATTLLKSRVYRRVLNHWFTRLNPSGANRQDDEVALELELQLNRLSNKYAILELELMELQESIGNTDKVLPSKKKMDSDAGFMIAELLIRHFNEFCSVDGGALVEPSVMHPIIVPADMFEAFLDWKEKELPNSP